MKVNDIETVGEETELQQKVTDPRNIQFEIPADENQDFDSLSEDEKARWRKIFNNLDKIDNKKRT